MLQDTVELISKIVTIASLLLSVILLSIGIYKLFCDTRKTGKIQLGIDTIVLLAVALLVPLITTAFLKTQLPVENRAHDEPIFVQTDAEVFQMREGEIYVVGTMDEIMDWIDENDITHVRAIFQLTDREFLETWRSLHPEGIPSKEVATAHDREEFMHFAIVPKEAIP